MARKVSAVKAIKSAFSTGVKLPELPAKNIMHPIRAKTAESAVRTLYMPLCFPGAKASPKSAILLNRFPMTREDTKNSSVTAAAKIVRESVKKTAHRQALFVVTCVKM